MGYVVSLTLSLHRQKYDRFALAPNKHLGPFETELVRKLYALAITVEKQPCSMHVACNLALFNPHKPLHFQTGSNGIIMLFAGNNVVVTDSGHVASGTGLKRELFDAEVVVTDLPSPYAVGQTTDPFSNDRPASPEMLASINPQRMKMRAEILKGIARRANAWGDAIIAHIKANAVAVVRTTDAFGSLPDDLEPGAPILPPQSEIRLRIE